MCKLAINALQSTHSNTMCNMSVIMITVPPNALWLWEETPFISMGLWRHIRQNDHDLAFWMAFHAEHDIHCTEFPRKALRRGENMAYTNSCLALFLACKPQNPRKSIVCRYIAPQDGTNCSMADTCIATSATTTFPSEWENEVKR